MIQQTISATMLSHPIKDHLTEQQIDRLFGVGDETITRFNSFCDRLERVAQTKHGDDEDARNKFKGDLFELFVEFLLKTKGYDNRIAIDAYRTSQEAGVTDYGVDGIGRSTINSRMCAVQAKYRQHNEMLTRNSGQFSDFANESGNIFRDNNEDCPPNWDNTQMLYITSAGSTHYRIDEQMRGRVRIINRQGLRELCDGVCEFWIQFKNSVLASRIQPQEMGPPKSLRDHQQRAVNAIVGDMLLDDGQGRVILPTGTGKTLIQAQTIIEAWQDPNLRHKCFLVLSPRILLSFQHLVEISDHLVRSGVDAQLLNVNSGNFDENQINIERRRAGLEASHIPSTTRPDEIARAFRISQQENKPLIISSTYHSAHRIREAGIQVDLQLNDEAHNMVSEEFTACHGIGNNSFHFTATERRTDAANGLGMQNEELWGNMTFEELPKDMIDAGEMLPPTLHIVVTNDQPVANDDYGSIFAAIGDSFGAHRNRLLSKSVDPTAIGPKMLVTVGGQEVLRGLIGRSNQPGCPSFELFRRNNPGIRIFAISSELGAYIDGRWLLSNNNSKDELLQEVRDLNSTDEAIILYVDMLTEGIDVPGITAFMPLRGMGEARFKQGMGRAVRLHESDRQRFYGGEISPSEPSGYVKPEAEIVVPTFLINSRDTSAQFVQLWQSMYDTFGHHERVVLSRLRGMDEQSALEDLNEVEHNGRGVSSGVDQFLHAVIGRPDRLDVNEIALISAIGQGSDEMLVRRLQERMNLHAPLDTYRSIADWQGANFEDYSQDLIRAMRTSGNSVFSETVKKKFGTIYTPEFVVEKTVDLAWKYLPEDTSKLNLTYCDPAVGDGNFLEHLHAKLMRETSIKDPIKRSHFILTKCLFGFEILEPMVQACKVRLILAHQRVIDENDGDRNGLLTLWDELNIYHGNTICLPEDTQQEWYQERGRDEGGLLPEELREKKFDVIVGNPPYTHLRNLQNRRYAAYPKQRDMAQVFVRWALDHLTEKGVVSLNASDAWLNVKLSDGALETRQALDRRIREIMALELYSEGDGGNISTFIICASCCSNRSYQLDGDSKQYDHNDLARFNFIPVSVKEYQHKRLGEYCLPVSLNRGKSMPKVNSWIRGKTVVDGSHSDYSILAPRHLGSRIPGAKFKLCMALPSTLELSGEWKYLDIHNNELTIWLFGCLNTTSVLNVVQRSVRQVATNGNNRDRGDWIVKIDNRKFAELLVPDFDFYKQDRSERFQAYMDWVEANMRDKDAFLAGIDEQFEKLIANTEG